VRLKNGRPIHRPGLIGQPFDLTAHTKVVEFNDVAALEAALAPGDVACLITEPALTNIGMVLPQPASTTPCARSRGAPGRSC
jgi:glutamate-1-semialdehyde 2,1-aminomutase